MAWAAYRRALQTHPFSTKALTTSCITGLSDIGLQIYENDCRAELRTAAPRKQVHPPPTSSELEIKWSRTVTLAAVGLVYSGPVNHIWFATLEKLVRCRVQIHAVLTKLLVDQTLFVPIVISGYMAVRGLFEGKSQGSILKQLKERVPVATAAAWQFWPIVNAVSFSVVPVMYRVLFGNICALFWNAKLSLLSTQTTEEVMVQYVEKLLDMEGFGDETLPTSGFDEAWALGTAANSQAIFATGDDEKLPTLGFDEAWALDFASSQVYKTGFDEHLPATGFDEAHAVIASSAKAVYGTGFDEHLPTSGFDEAHAVVASSCKAVYGTGFDEHLPSSNFDEAHTVMAESSKHVYGTGFDEHLPTSGFDEACEVVSGVRARDLYATGFDESLPTSGFDEAWEQKGSKECRICFDEALPTTGFDESWALSEAPSTVQGWVSA